MVAPATDGPTVLLLEDYPDMLMSSTMVLRMAGIEVAPCATANEAEKVLSAAEQNQRRLRLMVSDWNLQRSNASALVEHACRLGLLVIVLTGSPIQVQDWIERQASRNVRDSKIRIVTKGHDWLPAVRELLQ